MTAASNTHLVIADDHPLFRDALRQAVVSVVTSAVVSEAGSFDDLTALLERDSDIDLILLDLTMPGISGFSGLIYESIWSHYLKLFLGHAAYAQSLVLIIFMGGLGLGSWLVARFSERWRTPLLWYAIVEGVIGVVALVFHKTFVSMSDAFYFSILPEVDSVLLGSLLKWGSAAALILPQSVLLGMTFPLMSTGVIRRYPDHPGGSLAMLYFTNSIGAAAIR